MGSRLGGKKLAILAIFHFFFGGGAETPKYSRISVKFGTAEGTFGCLSIGSLSRDKFHANP